MTANSTSHRSLLFGLLDILLAVTYTIILCCYAPSRHIWFNVLAIFIFAAFGIGGVGMLTHKRVGAVVAKLGATAMLVFGLVFVVVFLVSSSELVGLYGNIGGGIALMGVAAAVLLLQAVCLLPIVQLCWLRHPWHRRQAKRRRARTIGAVLAVATYFGSLWLVSAWWAYPNIRLIDEADGQIAVNYLRCRLQGGSCDDTGETASLLDENDSVVFGSLYQDGRRGPIYMGEGPNLTAALEALGDALVEAQPSDIETSHLRVDFVTARGSVLEALRAFFVMSFAPGLDGVGLQTDTTTAWLLPYELHERELLNAAQPFYFMQAKFGVDVDTASSMLYERLGGSPWEGQFFRFRIASFMETEPGHVQPLFRNSPLPPPVTREHVQEAISAAADWVVNTALMEDGRFHYQYDPIHDEFLDTEYSWPRHAGTTTFLLQAYDHTNDARYLNAAQDALDHLWTAVTEPCGRWATACVTAGAEARLGSSAIATAAYAEHYRLTGSESSLERARLLGAFLLMMQKENGDFYHRYGLSDGIDQTYETLYFSGEAAYSLALLATIDPEEPAWRDSVRATMEFWIGPYWGHFPGGFFFIEEHWTCLAIEAAHGLFNDERYDQLCFDIAHFNARLLHGEDSSPFADFEGGIGFGDVFAPQTTTTATRAEAMVAAYRISLARGEPDDELADSIRLAYRFLLAAQYDERFEQLLPNPERARGGFRHGLLGPITRIDFNQHAGSALLRGVDFVFEP